MSVLLAKLRRGTELALGYPGASLGRAECSALVEAIEALEIIKDARQTPGVPMKDTLAGCRGVARRALNGIDYRA